MLLNPPPGYSPPSVTRQTVQGYGSPGPQGLVAQGYTQGAPAGSMLPSSYLPPSSTPNPFGAQQTPTMGAQAQGTTPSMIPMGAPPSMPNVPAQPAQSTATPKVPPQQASLGNDPLGGNNINALMRALGGG